MKKIEFKISVIIPVWNAEKYIKEAVESVLIQEEVEEIILIEDNSPDNALEICQLLEEKFKKIKLLRHPKGENRGASASRNLGVSHAKCDYIAFLDADDWYLPNRFVRDKEVFLKNPKADVIYSYTVLSNEQETTYEKENVVRDIRAILGYDVSPKTFYHYILDHKYPPFHMNSITIKKSFIIKDKLFDERLELHEDSELYKRWFRRGYFYCGEKNRPVAIVRRHEENRISTRNVESRLFMFAIFIDNVGVKNMFSFEKNDLLKKILRTKSRGIKSNNLRRLSYYLGLGLAYCNKDRYLNSFYRKYLPFALEHYKGILQAKKERKAAQFHDSSYSHHSEYY